MSTSVRVLETKRAFGWPWVIGAGITLGVLGVIADLVGNAFWQEPRSDLAAAGYLALTIVGNAPGFWALAAVFAAGNQSQVRAAVARATTFLAAAVVSYYVANLAIGARVASDVDRVAIRWLVVVAVIGPLAGVIAVWLRSPTTWKPAVAVAGVIGLCAVDILSTAPMGLQEYASVGVLVWAAYLVAVAGCTWIVVRRLVPFALGAAAALLAGIAVGLLAPEMLWRIWG